MLSKKTIRALYVLMLLGTELAAMDNKPQLLDSLLNNPSQTIKEIYTTRHEFVTQAKQGGLDKEKDAIKLLSNLEKLSQTYEQKCPIFLMGECTAGDWFPCVFTRSLNPQYRKEFEERVSQDLITRIAASDNRQNPVTFTSFGCGGALSEMIILTKVLAQHPNVHLNIHLIEGNNICYVSAADFLGISRQITTDQNPLNFGSQYDEYVKIVKDKDRITDRDDNDVKVQLADNCFEIHRKYKQMLMWLTQTFPQAELKLFIHEFTDKYFEYVDTHSLSHADVVAAVDIQDEMSLLRGGPHNYAKLCIKTLEKKPTSSNIWMANDDKNNVEIFSISFSDSEGAMKDDLDDGRSMYYTVTKL